MRYRVAAILVCGLVCAGSAAAEEAMLPMVLSLEEAQRIAIQDSPSLKAAEARVEQAHAVLRQAQAAYLPSITSSITASVTKISDYDFARASGTSLFTGLSADDTFESNTGNLTIGYLLFDGFGRKFRTSAARFGRSRSEAALDESRRLILNAVSLAYYNVQFARESIRISEADETFNQRQLKEAKSRHEVGTGSLSDTLNFEVRIRAAQSALLESQRNSELALIALTRLMGVRYESIPDGLSVDELAVAIEGEIALPDKTDAIMYSFENRPDLREIRRAVDQTDANVKVNRSNYFPTLTASVSADGTGDANRPERSFFRQENVSKTIALRLQYDIYSGGARKARLHQSKAVHKEFQHILDGQEIAVAAEVREALQNLDTAQRLLVLQRETTSLVEENRDLVEKEYNAGQGSLVRLNQAQRDLISQQASYAFARVSLKQSWINLHTATGAILQR